MAQRLKFNLKGFRQIRTSAKVEADLDRRARRIANAAGDGFAVEDPDTTNRARRVVVPNTAEAANESRDPRVLLRAMEAGR